MRSGRRDMADSRALFEEAHDIILKAWSNERFSHQGKFRTIVDLRVIPKPLQQLPPIYVALYLHSRIASNGAEEWGHNLMVVPYAVPKPEMLIENFRIFREARAAHGITSEPEILAVYHFYCGETAEKAKQEPRDAMIRYSGCSRRLPRICNRLTPNSISVMGICFKGVPTAMMDYEGALYPDRVIFGDPFRPVRRAYPCNLSRLALPMWPCSRISAD